MLEVLKIALPSCITGLLTFLITRYQCQKKVPLEKMEKAYNKVYFPIYQLIKIEQIEREVIITKSEEYLDKYVKYVDRSTLLAFKVFNEATSDSEKKKAYYNYESNIINFNIKLRRQLGYLEPNVLNMYTYASKADKRIINILFSMSIFYISGILQSFITKKIIKESILFIAVVALFVLVYELAVVFIIFISGRIKRICRWLKSKRKNEKKTEEQNKK